MAKKHSSKKNLHKTSRKKSGVKPSSGRIRNFFKSLKKRFNRPGKVKLHKSFKRSYREDYKRDIEIPGIMHHIFATFKMIFKNWKLFLPLLVVVVAMAIFLIGLMSEASYQQFQTALDQTNEELGIGNIGGFAKASLLLISTITTGGLSSESDEAKTVFVVLIFLIIWLVTIFIVRHRLAEHKIKLRDGLYNAMTPLISTFVVFVVAVIQCIPIFLLVIFYSAAIQTDFLTTPFYALVFFIFAVAMLLLSGYLLSSSLIALVAVSAPGLYPIKALYIASDLMMGRRIKFILRIIALMFALAIIWVVVMLPLILFDLGMKNFEWTQGIPFVPICLSIMTCFTGIYITVYLYLYYRWMLDYDEK